MSAMLFSADPEIVNFCDAIEHLEQHPQLYWEVGFRVRRDRFSFPVSGFIHINRRQVEYKATIADILPFSSSHYQDAALAEQVKPARWRQAWDDGESNAFSHDWKTVLVMTAIERFHHETLAFRKWDGSLVKVPPRSYTLCCEP